jgi:hypothetical protein
VDAERYRASSSRCREGTRGTPHAHRQGAHTHVRGSPPRHVQPDSGGLAALAMAEMSTAPAAAVYVLLFGLGSMLGMAAVSAAAASMTRLAPGPTAWRRVRLGSGALAVAVVWGALALGRGRHFGRFQFAARARFQSSARARYSSSV